MWADVQQDQSETVRAAILNAANSTDSTEAHQKVFDFLMQEYPAGGPGNSGGGNRWFVGSAPIDDDTGSAVGCTTSLAWTTAGVLTSAAVYVSTTASVHSTWLGARSVPRHEVAGSDTPQDASVLGVGWSVPAEDGLEPLEKAVLDAGYSTVPARSPVLALLDVAEGRAAGFVGRVTDPAARLATALLISEAHGQVSDWSGRYPGPRGGSVVAGSHFTHFQRLARLLAAAIDPQGVPRDA